MFPLTTGYGLSATAAGKTSVAPCSLWADRGDCCVTSYWCLDDRRGHRLLSLQVCACQRLSMTEVAEGVFFFYFKRKPRSVPQNFVLPKMFLEIYWLFPANECCTSTQNASLLNHIMPLPLLNYSALSFFCVKRLMSQLPFRCDETRKQLLLGGLRSPWRRQKRRRRNRKRLRALLLLKGLAWTRAFSHYRGRKI